MIPQAGNRCLHEVMNLQIDQAGNRPRCKGLRIEPRSKLPQDLLFSLLPEACLAQIFEGNESRPQSIIYVMAAVGQ